MKRNLLLILLFVIVYQRNTAQTFKPAQTVSNSKLVNAFIDAAMVFPPEDLHERNEGKVIVTFKVGVNGETTQFEVKNGQSTSLNKEAIRLVKKIQWYPALHNGKAVEAIHTYTIIFNAKRYRRLVKARGYDVISLPFSPADTSGFVYNLASLDVAPKPIFENPKATLSQYIQENLKYPVTAYNNGISGTVKLKFLIETDGIISNIVVDQGIGGGCDNEAIRILNSIKWHPGVKGNRAVRSHAILEVLFKIADRKQQAIPNRQAGSM